MGGRAMIDVLPLDAWASIFRHVDERDLTRQFDILYDAGVFGGLDRLNTFWDIMGRLDMLQRSHAEPPAFDTFPNVVMYRECRTALVEMGLSFEHASTIAGRSHGELDRAIHLLGWDA